jgi:cytochrome c551/c552
VRLLAAAVAVVVLGTLTAVAFTSGDGGGAKATTVPVGAAGQQSGADLFRAKGCVACHDGPDSDSRFDVGPNLAIVGDVAGSRVEGLDAEAYVRQSIESPQAYIVTGYGTDGGPGGLMPSLPLTATEVDTLVAWLLHR